MYGNKFDTTNKSYHRYGGGLRSIAARIQLLLLHLPETWLLDAIMAIALICTGIGVWRNWAQVCAVVLQASATVVYVILALLGLMLALRLLLPRRMTRFFRH